MSVEHQNLTMILFQYFSCVFKIKFRRAVQMITNMIYVYMHIVIPKILYKFIHCIQIHIKLFKH